MASNDTHTAPLLRCDLCPKNPKFSDISHMLTHVSSKGHLSVRFNLSVRARTDLAAMVELEQYQQWYQRHNLDTLFSERLTAKNERQAAKERRQKVKASKAAIERYDDQTRANTPVIDPILDQATDTVTEPTPTPAYRPPVPRMHLWQIKPTSISPHRHNQDDQAAQGTSNNYFLKSDKHNFSSYDESSFIDPRITGIQTPLMLSPDKSSQLDTPESLTLKGTTYPGMDMFDSATPEMKKQRNRRKGPVVMQKMIAFSKEVEPLVTSYHPDGTVRGSRHVFDPPSCDEEDASPVKNPTPKKRKPRKAALSDLSINAPRQKKFRSPRNGSAKKGKKAEKQQVTRPVLHYPHPILNPFGNFGDRFGIPRDEDAHLKTVDEPSKKRPFGVFIDDPSPGHTESLPMNIDNLEELEEPEEPEKHQFNVPQESKLIDNSAGLFAALAPPKIAQPVQITGKENGYYQHSRRSISAPEHSQYSYGSSFNPIYMPPPPQQFPINNYPTNTSVPPQNPYYFPSTSNNIKTFGYGVYSYPQNGYSNFNSGNNVRQGM